MRPTFPTGLPTCGSMPLSTPIQASSSTSTAPIAWASLSPSGVTGPCAHDFERIVSPFIPEMVRACEAVLGSEDLAWDAVQETLLRVWGNGWLPRQPAAALVHLAVKSSLHQLRCMRRRSDHEARRDEELGAPCCEEDPLAVLEDADERRVVQEAVRGLTVEYRAVLELFAFDGESYESIAARLGVPLGTVRSRLNRGKALLRERLQSRIDAA